MTKPAYTIGKDEMLLITVRWNDGDTLFNLFTKTRAIRRSIIEQGQDDPKPDFGRSH